MFLYFTSPILLFLTLFISHVASDSSTIFFYPPNPNAINLTSIPEINEHDFVSLYTYTIRSSKHSSPLQSITAQKLLNIFAAQPQKGHAMLWVPGLSSNDVEFPMTTTLTHKKPVSTLYKSISQYREREYQMKTDLIHQLDIKDLFNFEIPKLPSTSEAPYFHMIKITGVSSNSPDFKAVIKSIHEWIRNTQSQHPDLTLSLLTSSAQLHRRELPTDCYTSVQDCSSKTNECHGQGRCVKYFACYRCQCNAGFNGLSCLYKDWSFEVAVFGGIMIVFVLFIGFGISLLLSSFTSSFTFSGMTGNTVGGGASGATHPHNALNSRIN